MFVMDQSEFIRTAHKVYGKTSLHWLSRQAICKTHQEGNLRRAVGKQGAGTSNLASPWLLPINH